MKEALYFLGKVPLDSISMDPPTRYMGQTPTVYPGAIGIGAADPAAEEAFNRWMDGFMNEPVAYQKGEIIDLMKKERAGTITDFEKRKLQFARVLSGEAKVPEPSKEELARLPTQTVEELQIRGEKPRSGYATFLAFLGLGAVVAIAAGKSKGK